jgi:CheY-like chemotaxis protein
MEESPPVTILSDEDKRRIEIVRSTGLVRPDNKECMDFRPSEENKEFDRLTALAARTTHCPVAAIRLIDIDFEWVQSLYNTIDGFDIPRVTSRLTFCSLCIKPDANKVIMVVNEMPNIPYSLCASTAIIVDGVKIGVLMVIDVESRSLSNAEQMNLLDVCHLVSSLVSHHRDKFLKIKDQRTSIIGGLTHNLRTPLNTMNLALDVLQGSLPQIPAEISSCISKSLASARSSLKVVSTVVESSLVMGTLFIDNLDEEKIPKVFAVHEIVTQAQSLLFVSNEYNRVKWTLDPSLPHGIQVSSYPDVLLFSLLHSISHFFTEWTSVEVNISLSMRWLPVGAAAQAGHFKRHSFNNVGTLCVALVLRNPLGITHEEHDTHKDVLNPISQMLNEVEGYSIGSFDPTGDVQHYKFLLPCEVIRAASLSPPNVPRPSITSIETGSQTEVVSAQTSPTAPSKPLSVLVVDDALPIQKVICKWLTLNKCSVEVASNGKVALEKMLVGCFDLVFMDFLMPVMGGVEAIRLYNQGRADINATMMIIGMSATATPDERVECFNNGMHLFCPKPVDTALLGKILAFQRENLDPGAVLAALHLAYPGDNTQVPFITKISIA